MRSHAWILGRRSLVGVLLALAGVALAPGQAWAGCSQHVVARAGALDGIAHLEILNAADSAFASEPAPFSPAPPSCSGPFCTKRAPLPTSTPLTVGASRTDVWGLPPCPVMLSRPSSENLAARVDLARVVVRTTPIHRPPR